MTKQELKKINLLKEENERIKNLVIRFMDALEDVKSVADIKKISLIPLMTEENKKIRTDIKIEAYKEYVTKHKEIMKVFLDDDNEFLMKWCEYEANTDNLLRKLIGEIE